MTCCWSLDQVRLCHSQGNLLIKSRATDHSLESSISADNHFLSQSGTTRAISERSLQLSSTTRTKCCGTCARRHLRCYHGPNFFKNQTHFSKKWDLKGFFFRRGTFYQKNGPKRDRFYQKEGTFTRNFYKKKGPKWDARTCVSFFSCAGRISKLQ